MRSIIDQLPPEIAQRIHPDRRKNEEQYWAMREQLLAQYAGQWIGFADGVVIASGRIPVEVFHAAESSGRHPFFIRVGMEEEPCRIRRAEFRYDADDGGEPLPVIQVEFRTVTGAPGVVLDRVIPDTGADASVLPWERIARCFSLIPVKPRRAWLEVLQEGSRQRWRFRFGPIWMVVNSLVSFKLILWAATASWGAMCSIDWKSSFADPPARL
jgi:hypothetical protein